MASAKEREMNLYFKLRQAVDIDDLIFNAGDCATRNALWDR
jgi:hypothetical protein